MKVERGAGERLRDAVREGTFSYGGLLTGLFTATFCIRASFGAAVVLLSLYLPPNQALFGLVFAITPLAELIAVPFAGVANDRYGRRNILLGGLALATLSLGLRMFTRDVVPHIVLNVFHGISAALILVTSLALLADYASAKTRGREMGIFDFMSLFGWMAGFMLGLALKDVLGDATLWLGFAAAALLGVLGLAVSWPTVREPQGHQAQKISADLTDVIKVGGERDVLLVLAPWLIVFMFLASFTSFIERLSETIGLTGLQTALSLAVLTIVLLAANVGYGRLSDRFGRGPFILLGAWGFFAFTTAVAFLTLSTGSATGGLDPEAFVRALPVYGPILSLSVVAALAFGPAALAALADEAQKRPSGVTMSLYSLVVGLGFILGPITTGAVVEYSGSGGLAVLLFVEGVGLVLLVSLRNYLVARS